MGNTDQTLENINKVIEVYCDWMVADMQKYKHGPKAEDTIALANLVNASANYKMAYRCMEPSASHKNHWE